LDIAWVPGKGNRETGSGIELHEVELFARVGLGDKPRYRLPRSVQLLFHALAGIEDDVDRNWRVFDRKLGHGLFGPPVEDTKVAAAQSGDRVIPRVGDADGDENQVAIATDGA
jgi:hypothetical protein